jgi:hypothetical protein
MPSYCGKTETFVDVEAMLWGIVNKFIEKHGLIFGTRDELFSDTAVAFVKAYDAYDPESDADFSTYLYYKAHYALVDRVKKAHRRKVKVLERTINENDAEPIEKEPRWIQFLANLSDDAKAVVMLVIDTPIGLTRIIERDFGSKLNRMGVRLTLKSYLSGAGWSDRRIRNTFREITDNLR